MRLEPDHLDRRGSDKWPREAAADNDPRPGANCLSDGGVAVNRAQTDVGTTAAGDGAAGPRGQDQLRGSSNFAAWDVALAQSAASARHFLGLTSEQSLYNLAIRAVEWR